MSKLTIDDLIKEAEEADKIVEEAHKTGNYIKAKNAYQELYELYKRELGEKHPYTLMVLNNLAVFYGYLGYYKKACELQNAVYNAHRGTLGEKHPDTLKSLANLANSYSCLRDYNKALEMKNAVYNGLKEFLGEKHPDTLTALANLANTYSCLRDYNKALEMRIVVYNARKETLGENHPDTLSALNNLAISYSDLGNYNKALEMKNAVYNARKEILGENHPDTLSALNNLAISYSDLGDYDKALELYNAVYKAFKEILGEKHPDTLTALANLANSYSDLGNYSKALEIENKVYNARKEILGVNHPDTLKSLANLAISYSDLGDYSKALEMRNAIYNVRKEILGEKHPDTLTSLASLAYSYSDLGDYKTALEMRIAIYNRRKEILGEKHPDTLSVLSDLACSYSSSGDYYKAFELQKKVYNTLKEILGEKHPDTLFALNNLAISSYYLGDYNKAYELQNIVYNTRKEIQGENHPNTLSALNNLASFYSDLGDYNTALEMRIVVYNTRKENLGEKHLDTLTALANLANSYSSLGNYNKALEMRTAVYNTRKEIQGEKHPDTLMAFSNLAMSYVNLGDYNKALETENKVYNTSKEILGWNHHDTLTALYKLISIQFDKDKTDNQSIKKHMTTYFENINNLKTTAFNIKEVSSRRNFLESYNNVYKLLKLCVFDRKIKDLLDYVFINKNLSFEMDVNRFHNETMGERLSLEEVSHMISNKLVIDFYELDNSKYGLILIKQGKYSYYMVEYPDIVNGSFIDAEDIKLFIGSFEDYDHIYICPDGKLYNLSFERILNYLNISYLSSVQTLFKKNTDDDSTNQLVSFVYPDFSGRLSDDNDRGDKKGVLYGSYLEGMFIHDIYGERSTIYSSYQANHDNFLNTRRPRILHVSTHGDYLDNENMEPMDRGILCLSGYNVEDNNFGYISAKEIQYMDLKGTELVVLSACNTGLGENISGEGIYGIRRAFELAGCQTLLLTVEEVDDFNSAIFMKSFYERYNQTNNIYQSFKDTKEYLKKYGLVELKELRDVFEKEMKNKIKNPFVYTRNFNELNKRIEESETIGQIVRKKNNQYIQEDWNGFIIQGKIEN